MKFGKLMMVSAAALAIGIASPALSQTTANGSGDDSASSQDNDANGNSVLSGNSLLSGNSDDDGNGSFNGNQDNDQANGNSIGSGNSDDDSLSFASADQDNDGNGSLNGSLNDQSDDDGIDDSLNGSFNGNDASDDDTVNVSDDDTFSVSDDDTLSVALSIADNSQDNDGNGNNRDNGNTIIAAQDLSAVITNNGIDEVVDMDESERLETGSNSVNQNAYAAFAGILTQSWNTGLNANTQAATNIAAQGTVNFGNGAPE